MRCLRYPSPAAVPHSSCLGSKKCLPSARPSNPSRTPSGCGTLARLEFELGFVRGERGGGIRVGTLQGLGFGLHGATAVERSGYGTLQDLGLHEADVEGGSECGT